MNQQYEKVPNMISGKDLDYLSDMFEWNYGAYKQAVAASESVEDEAIKNMILKAKDTFYTHIETILNVLEQGGCNE